MLYTKFIYKWIAEAILEVVANGILKEVSEKNAKKKQNAAKVYKENSEAGSE